MKTFGDYYGGLFERVLDEIDSSEKTHGVGYHSDHEAFAVLLEEVEEVKDWVWKKRQLRDRRAMVKELIQVSAVAIRWAKQLEDDRG